MDLLTKILKVAPQLHTAGTLHPTALKALADHAGTRNIRASVETGCGASTLLLSHLSEDHTVFALDGGTGSIANIKQSPLLKPGTVTFIEGPSQLTLREHRFPHPLQLVLLDGPHAYPFPDLEYYVLYPHLEPGALLVIDDIQIRTIHHLFQFLRQDSMFRLDAVVRTTAFFTRTNAPVFDPLGDGWWQQGYNRQSLFRYAWRERLQPWRAAMGRRRRRHLARSHDSSLEIATPSANEAVAATGNVSGSAILPPGASLWIFVHRKDVPGWWIQGGGPAEVVDGGWSLSVNYGNPEDSGHEFEIAAILLNDPEGLWRDQLTRICRAGGSGPIALPTSEAVIAERSRKVRKAAR